MSANTSRSQMLRVPTPLVDAVKELSRLHRSGYTSAVLTGLQQLIATIDSTADSVINITASKSDTELIAELIAGLDERIATQVAAQVAQLEQRIWTQLGDLTKPRDDLRELLKRAEDQTRITKEAETLAESQRTELEQIRQHRDELRLMLDDQATKAEQWYSKACELEQQIEQLQQSRPAQPLDESAAIGEDAIAANPLENMALGKIGEAESADAGNTLEDIPAPATPSNEPVEETAPSEEQHLEPMTSLGLAARLGVDNSSVSRNKDKGDKHFREWTAERDPDGISWQFRPGLKRSPQYHPLSRAKT